MVLAKRLHTAKRIRHSQNKLSRVESLGWEKGEHVADFDQQRLIAILEHPSETPRIECKGWLDLSDKRAKATLAKAAIALANYGGGTIVLGVGNDTIQGGKLVCLQKPAGVGTYSSDDVDSAINTYADPSINFELRVANHPHTNAEHTFVVIPSGITQPVFAKKSYTRVIEKFACYIRKPGPKSEKPDTGQEWRALYNRCLLANRESLLVSIRTILDGQPLGGQAKPTEENTLLAFASESQERWRNAVTRGPTAERAMLKQGYFEVAFSILDYDSALTLNHLRNVMKQASDKTTTVWYLFTDPYNRARPGGNAIETRYVNEESHVSPRYSLYYWRVQNDLRFYLLRAYQEDEDGFDPYIEVRSPVWRVGQTLLYAKNVADQFGSNLPILFWLRYSGLSGRRLGTHDTGHYRQLAYYYEFQGDTGILPFDVIRTTPREIEDNLIEVLHDLLSPLHEQFGFFELRRETVARAVRQIRPG